MFQFKIAASPGDLLEFLHRKNKKCNWISFWMSRFCLQERHFFDHMLRILYYSKQERKKSRGDTEPLIALREHDNWEGSGGRKTSRSIDQSSISISVASNPLLCLPLHPICTCNLEWNVFVRTLRVTLWSICPLLCACISFVFIYLLKCLSVTCQCRGTRISLCVSVCVRKHAMYIRNKMLVLCSV